MLLQRQHKERLMPEIQRDTLWLLPSRAQGWNDSQHCQQYPLLSYSWLRLGSRMWEITLHT